jgi:hypothetical protein
MRVERGIDEGRAKRTQPLSLGDACSEHFEKMRDGRANRFERSEMHLCARLIASRKRCVDRFTEAVCDRVT